MIGPQIPNSKDNKEEHSTIGPQIPNRNTDNDETSEEIGPQIPSANETTGPQLPSKRRVVGPSLPEKPAETESSAPKRRRAPQGPTLPAHLTQRPVSDDDDDIIGPMMPPQSTSGSELEQTLSLIEQRAQGGSGQDDGAPQREEWMMVPPTSQLRVDPLNMKNRQFNQSTRVSSKKDLDNTSWTETPQQKYERLIKGATNEPNLKYSDDEEEGETISIAERERQEKLESMVSAYNKEHRGASLMDSHLTKKNKGKKEEGKSERRPFDPEKDLKIGGTSGKDMVNKLKGMGGLDNRFQSSSGGKYL